VSPRSPRATRALLGVAALFAVATCTSTAAPLELRADTKTLEGVLVLRGERPSPLEVPNLLLITDAGTHSEAMHSVRPDQEMLGSRVLGLSEDMLREAVPEEPRGSSYEGASRVQLVGRTEELPVRAGGRPLYDFLVSYMGIAGRPVPVTRFWTPERLRRFRKQVAGSIQLRVHMAPDREEAARAYRVLESQGVIRQVLDDAMTFLEAETR